MCARVCGGANLHARALPLAPGFRSFFPSPPFPAIQPKIPVLKPELLLSWQTLTGDLNSLYRHTGRESCVAQAWRVSGGGSLERKRVVPLTVQKKGVEEGSCKGWLGPELLVEGGLPDRYLSMCANARPWEVPQLGPALGGGPAGRTGGGESECGDGGDDATAIGGAGSTARGTGSGSYGSNSSLPDDATLFIPTLHHVFDEVTRSQVSVDSIL